PRLVPVSLDTLGLADTLENLVQDWQSRYPDVKLSLQQELAAEVGPSVALTLYRVAQEGLVNALRHAQAEHIAIDLRGTAERILLTVCDDGVGLAPDWARPGRFGLRALAERVEHVGGHFSVENNSGRGMRLQADIPLTT
ncbi:MAG: hypothetical protein JOY91_05075, partial [Sinobacteraceae bacterium]|nr:hypothetical protein [Nevskiaceae bacterium]